MPRRWRRSDLVVKITVKHLENILWPIYQHVKKRKVNLLWLKYNVSHLAKLKKNYINEVFGGFVALFRCFHTSESGDCSKLRIETALSLLFIKNVQIFCIPLTALFCQCFIHAIFTWSFEQRKICWTCKTSFDYSKSTIFIAHSKNSGAIHILFKA